MGAVSIVSWEKVESEALWLEVPRSQNAAFRLLVLVVVGGVVGEVVVVEVWLLVLRTRRRVTAWASKGFSKREAPSGETSRLEEVAMAFGGSIGGRVVVWTRRVLVKRCQSKMTCS